MATTPPPTTAEDAAIPPGFVNALAFQWVNPKAWMFVVGTLAAFTTVGGDLYAETAIIAVVCAATCFPSLLLWAVFGSGIRRWLRDEGRRRGFNWAMASLLVLSLIPLIGV